MDNRKICPVIMTELLEYVYTNIKRYFSSINVTLSSKFLSITQSEMDRLIRSSIHEINKNLLDHKINFSDYRKIIGEFERLLYSKITTRAIIIIFSAIKSYEPPEIIKEFLKTPDNFTMLLYFCYKEFIEKTTKKNTISFHF